MAAPPIGVSGSPPTPSPLPPLQHAQRSTLIRARLSTPAPPSASRAVSAWTWSSIWRRPPPAHCQPRSFPAPLGLRASRRSEEHTSELQSLRHLVCRLLL